MNAGKKFENDWKNSIPTSVFYYRFRDGTANFNDGEIECPVCKKKFKNEATRFQQKNMCDCEMFQQPTLYLLELKSTKGKSLPFKNFKENQLKELLKASRFPGIISGSIINFRDVNETYFVDIKKIDDYMAWSDRKSLPIDWCRENGVFIRQERKKVNFRYDIEGFIIKTNLKEGIKYEDHRAEASGALF